MEVSKFKPVDGYLIVSQAADETKTKSGLILEENTDDFLVHATVKRTNSKIYKAGVEVVFNLVDADASFRDGADSYFLINEKNIRGTYGG